MAADDTHEFLTPPDSDGDERLGHAPDFDDAEWDLGALEREVAAAEALRLANGHRKICGALHLRYGDVSADDLARASLSDDPDIQCARLAPLFKMCGLIGVGHEIERADLIKTIADAGPQSETEMRLLLRSPRLSIWPPCVLPTPRSHAKTWLQCRYRLVTSASLRASALTCRRACRSYEVPRGPA
jgi:hypothetical protein